MAIDVTAGVTVDVTVRGAGIFGLATAWACCMRGVRVRFSRPAMRFLDWDFLAGSKTVPVTATDRLGDVPGSVAGITTTPAEMQDPGLLVAELPPLTAAYFELQSPMASAGR